MGSYIYFPFGTNTTAKGGRGWENTKTHGASETEQYVLQNEMLFLVMHNASSPLTCINY